MLVIRQLRCRYTFAIHGERPTVSSTSSRGIPNDFEAPYRVRFRVGLPGRPADAQVACPPGLRPLCFVEAHRHPPRLLGSWPAELSGEQFSAAEWSISQALTQMSRASTRHARSGKRRCPSVCTHRLIDLASDWCGCPRATSTPTTREGRPIASDRFPSGLPLPSRPSIDARGGCAHRCT
jgi:hypothetical protein